MKSLQTFLESKEYDATLDNCLKSKIKSDADFICINNGVFYINGFEAENICKKNNCDPEPLFKMKKGDALWIDNPNKIHERIYFIKINK